MLAIISDLHFCDGTATKKSATFDSMLSSEPDSSPIETIWMTMFGNTLVFCMALVSDTPVATSP